MKTHLFLLVIGLLCIGKVVAPAPPPPGMEKPPVPFPSLDEVQAPAGAEKAVPVNSQDTLTSEYLASFEVVRIVDQSSFGGSSPGTGHYLHTLKLAASVNSLLSRVKKRPRVDVMGAQTLVEKMCTVGVACVKNNLDKYGLSKECTRPGAAPKVEPDDTCWYGQESFRFRLLVDATGPAAAAPDESKSRPFLGKEQAQEQKTLVLVSAHDSRLTDTANLGPWNTARAGLPTMPGFVIATNVYDWKEPHGEDTHAIFHRDASGAFTSQKLSSSALTLFDRPSLNEFVAMYPKPGYREVFYLLSDLNQNQKAYIFGGYYGIPDDASEDLKHDDEGTIMAINLISAFVKQREGATTKKKCVMVIAGRTPFTKAAPQTTEILSKYDGSLKTPRDVANGLPKPLVKYEKDGKVLGMTQALQRPDCYYVANFKVDGAPVNVRIVQSDWTYRMVHALSQINDPEKHGAFEEDCLVITGRWDTLSQLQVSSDLFITEGANTVSELISLGKPYLSVAPEGHTPLPPCSARAKWLKACQDMLKEKGQEGYSLETLTEVVQSPTGSIGQCINDAKNRQRDAVPEAVEKLKGEGEEGPSRASRRGSASSSSPPTGALTPNDDESFTDKVKDKLQQDNAKK